MITLLVAREQVDRASKLDATLSQVEAELEQALQELRELAHGLCPTELTQSADPPPSAPSHNDHEPMSTVANRQRADSA